MSSVLGIVIRKWRESQLWRKRGETAIICCLEREDRLFMLMVLMTYQYYNFLSDQLTILGGNSELDIEETTYN